MTHDVHDVRAFIRSWDDFYITGHVHPDGDAIGACFALGLALEKMGKRVRVILEPYHSRYNIIPGRHLIYNGEEFRPDATLICLDCADLTRLTPFARAISDSVEHTLCIDHHYSNTNFSRYNYVDSTCSSTCEMVYRILDKFIDLDQDIACGIYAGMVSDTGGFRYSATSQDTLEIASQLIALGVPFTEIYTELVHLRTYTEVRLLSRIIESCHRSQDAKIVHVCVPLSMMTGLNDAPDATIDNLDGVVEFLLNIRRAEVSLLVYERSPGKAKISLRSRNINVGAIARHFGGGGHQLAAGASVDGDIYEIHSRVLPLIEKVLKEVN